MQIIDFTEEELKNERWLPVINCNGHFKKSHLISNLGRVKTLFRKGMKRERLLMQHIDGDGYWRVKLAARGESKSIRVHTLVGPVHVVNPKPKEYKEINHKKGNKLDNRAWELEWCTTAQNMKHAVEWGLTRKGRVPTNARSVSQYDLNGDFLNKFNSVAEAARSVGGIGSGTLCFAIKNKTKSYGYVWAYDGEVPIFDCVNKVVVSSKMKPFAVYKAETVVPKSKHKERVIIKGEEVYRGVNIAEACRVLGLTPANARHCLVGERPTVNGYVFQYE